MGFDEPNVGWNDISRFEEYYIPCYQISGGYIGRMIVAAHFGVTCSYRFQRLHCFFSTPFLNEADDSVDNNYGQYHDGVGHIAYDTGYYRCPNKDQNHEVRKLAEQYS